MSLITTLTSNIITYDQCNNADYDNDAIDESELSLEIVRLIQAIFKIFK